MRRRAGAPDEEKCQRAGTDRPPSGRAGARQGLRASVRPGSQP